MTFDFFPFPLFMGIVILIIMITILWKRKRSLAYIFCFSIFWIYILLLVKVTIFPIPFYEDIRTIWTKQQVTFTLSHINLVPFKYLGFFNKYVIFREIIRNILLTIPFGFGIRFITPFRARNILWLAIAVGLVIEITQLVISLGIVGVYRTVDVTDVLLNAGGVLLGYVFFKVFAWGCLTIIQRLDHKHRGLSAYIHNVARRASE